jgi:hypothetical protein
MLGHGAKRGHHIHLICISSKSLGPYTPHEAARLISQGAKLAQHLILF